jgi:membrane-associated protease RseP (regulator of RpoE activity)
MAHNPGFSHFDLQPDLDRPTRRKLLIHAALLLVTLCTATIAGILYPFGKIDSFPSLDPQNWTELFQAISWMPVLYASFIGSVIHDLLTRPDYLQYGLSFSLSLLFILITHEMGHYIACRIYRVDATLPFFIPTPPMFGPAGTFGAFIKIKSPLPSRKAIFDIGVAGPIAGFVALLPIAVLGVSHMHAVPAAPIPEGSGAIVFSDPLLMRLIALAFGIDLSFATGNAFYYAAWLGLLVTALNLIPSGQLDGGHAIFAVFGEKVHYWTGRIAFVLMASFSVFGMYFYGSPSGFLIAILLGVMMRIRHPRPWDETPLDGKRKAVAVLTLVIFVLSFMPFPIQIV